MTEEEYQAERQAWQAELNEFLPFHFGWFRGEVQEDDYVAATTKYNAALKHWDAVCDEYRTQKAT